MDGGSLAASTSVELYGWLLRNTTTVQSEAATALGVHRRLVDLASGRSARRLQQVSSTSKLRTILITEINTISAAVVEKVPTAFDAAKQSGATYLLEFEPHGGGTIRETYDFDGLPFSSAKQALFGATGKLRLLPAVIQHLVVESFDLEWNIRSAVVHEGFALEDGDQAQLAVLRSELGSLRERLEAVQKRIGPEGDRIRQLFLRDLTLDNLHRLKLVIDADSDADSKSMHQVSKWFDLAAEALLQPLPFSPRNTRSQLATAKAAWSELRDHKDTLHVLAVWLRALASSSTEARHCSVCYRHLGEGSKKFCVVHQRIAGQRQPAREFHIGRRFPAELSELLARPELNQALRKAGSLLPPVASALRTNRPGVPDALSHPAGSLEAVLAALKPVLGKELQPRAEQLVRSLVKVASAAYEYPRDSDGALEAAYRRDRARRWLSWSTVLIGWYSREIPGPYAGAPSLGGYEFDVDHPAARGEYVDQGRVTLHLVKQRAWVRAGSVVDNTTYFNVAYATRRHREGASLREIARELGASHEAVRRNLLAASDSGSGKEPRLRKIGRYSSKRKN